MDMQLSAVYTLDEKGRLIPVGPGQNSGHSVDNPSHSKPMLSPIHTQGLMNAASAAVVCSRSAETQQLIREKGSCKGD